MFSQVRNLTLVTVLSIFATTAVAKGDPERGATLNSTCVACHGPDGNSLVPQWPKIAGQHYSYLYDQIKEIQKGPQGKRNEPTMWPMVKDLTEQDIHDLSAFYAAGKMTSGEATKDTVELGKSLYRFGDFTRKIPSCMSCHGPAGQGNGPAKMPLLAGQHKEYTVLSLNKYKSDERGTGANGIMQDIAKLMTDADMEAVANYIQGLHE